MLAEIALDWKEEASTTTDDLDSSAESFIVKIEKMLKQFKSHHCASELTCFIKSTVVES
jgi:hypothetical protein